MGSKQITNFDGTLTGKLAEKFNLQPESFMKLLKNQLVSVGRNEPPVTNEELALVMMTLDRYNLDANMKQVHCFRHKGKMQVMVGVDGWVAFAERQKDFKGITFEYPEELVDSPDGKGRKCWEWVKATCHREGREPTSLFVFLEEWYQNQKGNYPSPWQSYTRSRLQQKAYCQAVRMGMGFAVWDETDMEIMTEKPDTAEASEIKMKEMSEALKVEPDVADESEHKLAEADLTNEVIEEIE